MHINHYFIDTLVLCFSCGCDKNGLNINEGSGPYNVTQQCTMNPAQIVIDKHVSWTENVGDDCEKKESFQYEVEPIKEMINFIFSVNGTQEKPTQKPTQKPTDSLEPVSDHNPTMTINEDTFSLTNISGMTDALNNLPDGPIIVFITSDGEENPEWQQKAEAVAGKQAPVIIIKRKDKFKDPHSQKEAALLEAEEIANAIANTKIDPDRLVFIGFGENAHVAGITGFHVNKITGFPAKQIIALNPEGNGYTPEDPPGSRLSKGDAKLVVVLHTEGSKIGYCCNIGDIDIHVNNIYDVQPWCNGDHVCAHQSALKLFVFCQQFQPVLITKNDTKKLLDGFPLNVSVLSEHGVYYLNVTDEGKPVPQDPSGMYEEMINHVPTVTFPTSNDLDTDKLKVIAEGTESPELQLQVGENNDPLVKFMKKHPMAEIVIIITEQKYDKWADKLKDTLLKLPGPRYVIIVDWSDHVYPPYTATGQHALLVATEVYRYVIRHKINPKLIEIIGFSQSAHSASYAGVLLSRKYGLVNRVTALDPIKFGWLDSKYKVSTVAANLVQVIHTNGRYWGIPDPIGHYDFYIDNGAVQSYCYNLFSDSKVDDCSHEAAVPYYIQSITTAIAAYRAALKDIIAYKISSQFVYLGYRFTPDKDIPGTKFVVPGNPNGVELPGEKIFNDLVISLKEVINNKVEVFLIPSNHRIVEIGKVMRTTLQFLSSKSIYLLIDGEYLDESSKLTKLEENLLKIVDNSYVIRLDWKPYVSLPSAEIDLTSAVVAKFLAKILIETNALLKRVHVIGYSAGAHIAGLVGKIVKKTGKGMLGSITALDPSKYYFEQASENQKLSKDDALKVTVYHTNIFGYGYMDPIGHADFYVNNGHIQPGCHKDNFCAHQRAINLYIESFKTRVDALEVKYGGKGKLIFIKHPRLATFGFHDSKSTTGVYYIRTQDHTPYLSFESPMTVTFPVETEDFTREIWQEIQTFTITFPPDETEINTFTHIIPIPG